MMSWQRSHGDSAGQSSSDDAVSLTPSELVRYGFAPQQPDFEASADVPDPGTQTQEPEFEWRCITCQHAGWTWVDGFYRCLSCNGTRFYDTSQPTRFDTDDGVWTYQPSRSPSNSPVAASPNRPTPQLTKPSGPPDAGWYWEDGNGGEHAESETLTSDPCVTPSGTESTNTRRRRRRRNAAAGEPEILPASTTNVSNNDRLLQTLTQLLDQRGKKHETNSNSSWTSRRGPEPGVRWRGGTPPQPPQWKYSNTDLRAFSRWERKIRVWQMQVKGYMSAADSALMLYTNLSGEAELEVEHLQLDKINSKDGVDYILETLRGPLQQKELFQKRKLLADFETVSRIPNESIRQFINRYRRIEKDLEAIGISCGSMYDSESKGNRVLERAKLSPELQRLVLIGAGNTLDYDKICESLLLQFPDFKPVPAIFTSYQGATSGYNNTSWKSHNSQGRGKGSSSSSTSSTTAASSSSGFSKSSGKGRFGHRRVFQTDHQDDNQEEVAEENEELQTVDEGDEDEFQDPCDDDDESAQHPSPDADDGQPSNLEDTIAEIAEVLTVTSKKLQASVLGRKFSNRRSIEERKKNSSCSACGQMGHWAGDAVCTMSAQKGKSDGAKGFGKRALGRGSSQSSSSGASNHSTKKAFVVTMPPVVEDHSNDDQTASPSFFTFMVSDLNNQTSDGSFEAFIAETVDFAGYMVLDTACQRSCCSREWLDVHVKILNNYNMDAKIISANDTFQFGAGPPKSSHQRAYFPISFDGQDTQGLVLGASVVDAKIPFLVSRLVFERLGAIIDFLNKQLHLTKLGIIVPLVLKHGHLAVKISCFGRDDHKHESWKRLSTPSFWHDPDPELLIDHDMQSSVSAPQNQFDPLSQALAASHVQQSDQRATDMASGLERVDHQGHAHSVSHLQEHVQDGETWHDAEGMDDCNGAGDSDQRAVSHSDATPIVGLHSQRLPPLRQQARQVCPVPTLHDEVPLERRHGRLGGSWSSNVAKFFALASTLIFNNCASVSSPGDTYDQRQGEESDKIPNLWGFGNEAKDTGCTQSSTSGASDLGAAWDDFGRVHGRHERSGDTGSLRFRRSGQVPRLGAGILQRELHVVDHWEVKKGTCIRHHVAPRLMTFDLHHSECPVPKSRLQPMCKVEAEFITGGGKMFEYNWLNQPLQQLSQQWTGRTIFRIRNTANETSGLLSSTSRRRLRTGVREALQVRLAEKKMLESSTPPPNRRLNTKVDILETFAGQANISRRATSFGMKAAFPIDYNTGFDLAVEQDQDAVDKMLQRFKPLVLIQALDCKDWCLLQDNVNYVRRKILLLMRRRKARKIARKVVDWCFQQMEKGRYFLIENPLTSRLWQEDFVKKLMTSPGVCVVSCHAGAYGAVNSHGQMIRKAHQWVTNAPLLAARLQRRLTPDQLKQCVPLEGKETTLSQVYCPDLVKEILLGVRETARLHDPHRFDCVSHQALAVSIRNDFETWREAIELAERTFSTTSFRNFVLPTTDPLYSLVEQISGWRLERVQISQQPTLMRFPSHVPHTHRGWVLSFADGSFEAQSEDLAETRHPRSRFAKPVRTAIFFFGYADEEQPQPPSDRPVDDPSQLVGTTAGFSFKGGGKFSNEIKTAVIRMHRNLGHPHASDLKKLLAMNGIRNQQIHDAVECLQCDSCLRVKGPSKPPPAGIPQEGYLQFADAVQMDVFYVRDVRGQNYMFLGVIDEVTHLHMAFHVATRNPADISAKFQTCWVRSFGWPLKVKTDPDGAFRAQFEADMNEAGCFVDFVPPESHHKMGLIERHNATMRSLMERVIDSRGAAGDQQMEMIAVAASFAKNACTWSSGRPPYIAAFGRIPRMGLDLISDPHGLVAGSTRSEVQHQAALLRSEAQQHLAAMAVDSGFRRALLRKSPAGEILDVPIGAVVAYWRWTAKSSKKKGGYKLARLLGRDPDGQSMWLQAGTNTIKVLPHQVRAARGFEEWNPDYEDIKALRTASDNLQSNFLQDETVPEPSEDGSQPQGIDQPEFLEDTEPNADGMIPLEPISELPQEPTVQVPIPIPLQLSQPAPSPSQEEAVQTDGYELEPASPSHHLHLNVSSPTNINIHNQRTFGMTQQQLLQPQVRIPVRKQHQKRGTSTPTTPARSTPQTPTLPPARPHELPAPGPSSIAPLADETALSAASSSRPSLQTLHGTAPPTPILTPVPEVIDLEDPQEQALASVGMSAPSTPPQLKLTPAKRSSSHLELELPPPATEQQLSTLMASTKSLFKFDHNSYQIAPDCKTYPKGLNVWRRLDYENQVLQTTHLRGPSKPSIQHRRVYQLDNGKLLHDAPYAPHLDGQRVADHRTCTLTELWYPDAAQHHYDMIFDENQQFIRQVPRHFDGTPDLCPQQPCNAFFQVYLNSEKPDSLPEDLSSDSEDENEVGKPPSGPQEKLSRLQQKALDKEIPWRRIMESPPEIIQAYIKAVQKEEESWKSWSSVRPLSQEEANHVMADKNLKRRILRSRAAFRDKAKGVPPVRAKARVVALGHLDPDLFQLSRESATPCRQSEYLLLALYISGCNRRLLSAKSTWKLWSGDVQTAFLQGDPEPRSSPLYLLPPQDGICGAARVFRSPLYEITGNIYGLANAPRTWGRHVVRTLLNDNWKQHTLDKMLFYKYEKFSNEPVPVLSAVLIAYVDDFLLTHDERFDRQAFISLFKWGSQSELDTSNPIEFKGKQLKLVYDDNDKQYILNLNQAKFIEAVKGGKVSSKKFKDTISAEDMSEFRSVAGCLQWVSGQTRPDVASTVSLSSRGTKSTYQNLHDMYQAISHLQQTKDDGFNMLPTNINDATIVACYSDSSWANAEGHTSQHGTLILLADPKATDFDMSATLIDWKSSRSSRVCRSTLAAETSACDTSLDRGSFLASMLTELITDVPSYKQQISNRLITVTDCRSLYDVLVSENPRTDEKRTIVTIRSCQQFVQRTDVFWVPTHLQWADGLTKVCTKLMYSFHEWLQKPWMKLHE